MVMEVKGRIMAAGLAEATRRTAESIVVEEKVKVEWSGESTKKTNKKTKQKVKTNIKKKKKGKVGVGKLEGVEGGAVTEKGARQTNRQRERDRVRGHGQRWTTRQDRTLFFFSRNHVQ
jgi:hypothetical protein